MQSLNGIKLRENLIWWILEGYFNGKEILVAIDGDDLITIQLLVNAIVNNDFKNWEEIREKILMIL